MKQATKLHTNLSLSCIDTEQIKRTKYTNSLQVNVERLLFQLTPWTFQLPIAACLATFVERVKHPFSVPVSLSLVFVVSKYSSKLPVHTYNTRCHSSFTVRLRLYLTSSWASTPAIFNSLTALSLFLVFVCNVFDSNMFGVCLVSKPDADNVYYWWVCLCREKDDADWCSVCVLVCLFQNCSNHISSNKKKTKITLTQFNCIRASPANTNQHEIHL